MIAIVLPGDPLRSRRSEVRILCGALESSRIVPADARGKPPRRGRPHAASPRTGSATSVLVNGQSSRRSRSSRRTALRAISVGWQESFRTFYGYPGKRTRRDGEFAFCVNAAPPPGFVSRCLGSSSSSLDEAPEPVARTATTERAAPVQPLPAPRAVEVVGAPAHAEPPAELPDEPQFLAMLHDLAGSDPQRSLKLAREAVERFPDGPDAPEFEWNVVKALFNMGRLEEAKDEARLMVEEYPGTYFAGDVDHHLLHPPPNPQ